MRENTAAAKSVTAKSAPERILPPATPSIYVSAAVATAVVPDSPAAKAVDPDSAIAGYVRTSVLTFPPDCREPAARVAFVQQLAGLRRTELAQAAAARGQAIGAWYEDLDRSGRAEFRAGRDGFEALTLAARSGRLKGLFAWDLSRLFRDLVGQELWLEEMEARGVAVHVQDLPFAVDAPTRRLLRQELGMINEYQAARVGALFSAALNQRVEQGQWVGRTYSQWGLRYEAGSKGFVRDEATAPLICQLYAAFNALGGSASQAARTLNRALAAGQPGALRPSSSARWDVTKILLHLRDPLYRRRTRYNGAEYDAPHLIPEVVPAEVVAETDRLLASRQGIYEECAARLAAPPEPYLYARRLRCAECDGGMQACPRQVILGPSPGLRVLWICGEALRGGACRARFHLPQPRLTALLERGLRQAFVAARQQMEARPACPEEEALAQEKRRRLRRLLQGRIHDCDRTRARRLESYAAGLVTDRAALESRLAALSERRSASREALLALRTAKAAGPREERWRESEAGRLEARFEAVWPRDGWLPRDPAKAQLLADLGLTASVRIHPMRKVTDLKTAVQETAVQEASLLGVGGELLVRAAPPPRVRGCGPFVPRQRCGLCEIDLVCPVLGIGDTQRLKIWETEQELRDYNEMRRTECIPIPEQ